VGEVISLTLPHLSANNPNQISCGTNVLGKGIAADLSNKLRLNAMQQPKYELFIKL
jgi:hypothetical protein